MVHHACKMQLAKHALTISLRADRLASWCLQDALKCIFYEMTPKCAIQALKGLLIYYFILGPCLQLLLIAAIVAVSLCKTRPLLPAR